MPPWLALLPRRALMLPVRFYRFFLSPWIGSRCLYEPTCSRYALDALARHGALAGSALAAGRILRCHPWCAASVDPVPERPPRLFAFLSGDGDAPDSSKKTVP